MAPSQTTTTLFCGQEPRLGNLEATQNHILETLDALKDLLATAIRSEERISHLQRDMDLLQERVRNTEKHVYSSGWVQKVLLGLIAVALGMVVRGALQ